MLDPSFSAMVGPSASQDPTDSVGILRIVGVHFNRSLSEELGNGEVLGEASRGSISFPAKSSLGKGRACLSTELAPSQLLD